MVTSKPKHRAPGAANNSADMMRALKARTRPRRSARQLATATPDGARRLVREVGASPEQLDVAWGLLEAPPLTLTVRR